MAFYAQVAAMKPKKKKDEKYMLHPIYRFSPTTYPLVRFDALAIRYSQWLWRGKITIRQSPNFLTDKAEEIVLGLWRPQICLADLLR